MITLSIFGAIVLLFGIVMLIIYPGLRKEPFRYPTDPLAPGYDRTMAGYSVERSPSFLLMFNRRNSLITIIVGAFMFLSVWLFFYSEQGYQYYLISPTGSRSTVYEQGFHWRGFATVQPWDKYFDIKGVKVDEHGTPTEDYTGVEGPMMGGVGIMFIDRVTAEVYPYIRVQMPTDPDAFMALAEEFKTPQNLVMNTLIPTVREQVINTGYMYAGEDYVSGNASNFRQSIDDQLKNGGFAVDKKEYKDTIITAIQEDDRKIRDVKTRYEVKKRLDKNGIPIRVPHDITRNKLIISQVIVDNLILEKKFKDKLEAQRDLSAQKIIELQKVETSKAAQLRIVAEGERDKAQKRVDEELIQIKTLISIETDKKKEETKRELAEIALKTQRLESERIKVEYDAIAYTNRQMVSAGLTPQEKAQFQLDQAIGVAAEIAKIKLPEVYISGGSDKSGNSILQDLLGAEVAKKMLNP